MNLTVYNKTPVTADIDLDALARYLVRTGWSTWAFVEDCGVRWVEWHRGAYSLTIFNVADYDLANHLRVKVYRLAELEQRQPGDVLLDIAGAPRDLGRLINAMATASAHLVEAREALAAAETSLRAKPKKVERIAAVDAARARLEKAEADYEAAARELAAAERRRR